MKVDLPRDVYEKLRNDSILLERLRADALKMENTRKTQAEHLRSELARERSKLRATEERLTKISNLVR